MDSFEMIQRVLRILFYVLGIATLIGFAAEHFFGYPNSFWLYCGIAAFGCSIIRTILRFM